MKNKKSINLILTCFLVFILQYSSLYGQQSEKSLFDTTWQTLNGNWINNSDANSTAVVVRKDILEDTPWENIEIEFRLGKEKSERYMFGFVLNATDASKYGLVRFYTVNNQTNLQVGIWEYNHFRTFLNTPIGSIFSPDVVYKAIIEPNTNRKDWRPWVVKLIESQSKKVLFEKTLVNTMPLFGMGRTGIYTEGKKIDFLDYTIQVLPKSNAANDLKLAPLFKDGMVLQRNKKVSIWGYAKPENEVEVNIIGKKYIAKPNLEGKWNIQIGPLTATESTEIIVKSGKSNIKINNVAVGEVWLASGQSNMEMRIWQSDIRDEFVQDPNLRVFMQPGWPSENPLFDSGGEWIGTNHPQFDVSSATAYSFAKELRNKLKVPVGIICSYWGGTGAEAWTPRKALETDPLTQPIISEYNIANQALKDRKKVDVNPWFVPGQNKSPGALFNGMIYPHVPYGIQGVIWYQGESNANRAIQYHTLFPMLINSWRTEWNSAELSFYFVQLPKYDGGQSGAEILNAWPAIREAQRLTLQKVKNTGMAIALDLGNPNNIHPFFKREIGKRLARLALHDVYGFKDIVRSGPLLKSVTFENDQAILHFDETAKGLTTISGKDLKGFTIAGSDKKFLSAKAVIDKNGKSISVYANGVKNPKSVRYAWANNPEEANLINKEGLPASPFRTDDWAIFD